MRQILLLGMLEQSVMKTYFKFQNLLCEMKGLKIEFLGMAETHWTNETVEAIEYNDHVIILSSRNDYIHRQGVAIVLIKEKSNHMQGYHLFNQRIMIIQLKT